MHCDFLLSRVSVSVLIILEGKDFQQVPCFFLLFLAFTSEPTSYEIEYLFGQFGSAVLVVSSPKILPTLSLERGHNVGETALMLCQCCSVEAIGFAANTFPATNSKNSTRRVALVKNSSISATSNLLAFSLSQNQYIDTYSQQIK